jgi:fumarylacetoacetase
VTADRSDFPLENLPYGVFDAGGGSRVGVAIGDHVLDLHAVAGHLPASSAEALSAETLDPFLGLGRRVWTEARMRITALLSADRDPLADALHRRDRVEMLMPFVPGDYVDFYSSIEHATNLGKMFRPDQEPLLPNWRHLPVGYHGRASSVVVSGTPVVRPAGQLTSSEGPPFHGPTRSLDIELEVGFVTGPGNELGRPIPIDEAREHIFGLVLVNDWSARDIQRWEYQPLGPFLGKSFATSVSPWVVTLDALEPYLTRPRTQDPEPLEYLRTGESWAVDLELEVLLRSAAMSAPQSISRTNFAGMYWTMAQQLAHVTVNGTNVRPGDLYASGTVSGPDPGSYGSLIELTWGGEQPITLEDGSERRFLEDGDTVILRGWCERDGQPRIGFGECVGTVVGR